MLWNRFFFSGVDIGSNGHGMCLQSKNEVECLGEVLPIKVEVEGGGLGGGGNAYCDFPQAFMLSALNENATLKKKKKSHTEMSNIGAM